MNEHITRHCEERTRRSNPENSGSPHCLTAARDDVRMYGWTEERRKRQAARIKQRKPWLKSTGPRSAAGKEKTKMNAHKGGIYTANWRELRRLMKLQRLFVKQVNEKIKRQRSDARMHCYSK